MKTKEIPAIIMLIAGGLYCLLGIVYQVSLMDFCVQLLIVLVVFWMLGGIVRMVLDHFMKENENKAKEEEQEAGKKDARSETQEELESKKE